MEVPVQTVRTVILKKQRLGKSSRDAVCFFRRKKHSPSWEGQCFRGFVVLLQMLVDFSHVGMCLVQHFFLVLQRCSNEALEQGMGTVGAALELGM